MKTIRLRSKHSTRTKSSFVDGGNDKWQMTRAEDLERHSALSVVPLDGIKFRVLTRESFYHRIRPF